MGLDVYLYDGEKGVAETPSAQHPKHLWNLAYLRSSYNSSGFNQVVFNLVGKDLYYVFEPNTEEYEVRPDLSASAARATELAQELRAATPLRVLSVCHSPFGDIAKMKPEDALRIVREEMAPREEGADYGGMRGSYSNINGDFFLDDPVDIIAAIPGVGPLGSPGVHLVYKSDMAWYIAATDVLLEFIRNAQSLADPVLHWSG